MAGLYLHIPFCKQACYYCDFHFSTNQELRPSVVKALIREMELRRSYLTSPLLDTVYLGGGTPSLLSSHELQELFEAIHQNFQVAKRAEITIEVNPDDITTESLEMFLNLGINRLSGGVQSFHNPILEFFHRAHSSRDAVRALELARSIGFANLSLDLIYGVPGMDAALWRETIAQAVAFRPEHLSAYALTIEEDTVLGRWQKKKKFTAVSEDLVAEQFEVLMEELARAGYEHYEISNFCLPGFLSEHNTNYWRQKPYLGIGPSAHSFDGDSRQHNIRNNPLYLKAILEDRIPCEKEELTWANRVNEYIMTSLRTQWGMDLTYLEARFDFRFGEKSSRYLERLMQSAHLQKNDSRFLLTRKGKLLADKIAGDLFVSDEDKIG